MTKNEFKQFASSFGLTCRYSGKQKKMFVYGNQSDRIRFIVMCKNVYCEFDVVA
jgi:hypothetical protein